MPAGDDDEDMLINMNDGENDENLVNMQDY